MDPLDGEKIVAGVVIACHTEERWDSIMRAIASVQHQTVAAAQVIVAVDHNDSLGARLREVSEIEVVDHRGPAGASGTRNTGATLVRAPVIAFLDDDARAHPDWLGELLRPLSDPGVVGTGGTISPAWSGAAPRWFPGEFGWVVGASYTGLPDSTGPVRNVWSGNMAVRRDAFDAVGGFRPEFGKLGMASRPEDTDLCLRIHANAPQTSWIYVPAAVVEHEVPDSRAKFGFFLRRCYSEGGGKIELSAHLAEDRNLVDERVYLLRTVPHGVGRAVRERNLGRALAIIAGVIAAGAGALSSLVRLRPIKARAGLS